MSQDTTNKLSLRALRADKELTQSTVARDLGVPTTTYASWEANFGKCKLQHAFAVADYYGVSIYDIKYM